MKTFVKHQVTAFCSLAIAFVLFSNVPLAYAQQECDIITGAPATITGSIAATDTAQTSRLFRDGRAGTCRFLRTPTTSAGSYNSDSYTFTNTTGGTICVYADLDATGCGVATNQISFAAYNGSYNPASILTNIIGDPGLSTGGAFQTSMNFSVPAGGTYVIVVHNVNATTTCASYTVKQTWARGCRQPGFDFNNDSFADLAVVHTSGGLATWSYRNLANTQTGTVQFGNTGDVPVPGDYNGDEQADIAVYRPGAQGVWYTSNTPANNYGAKYWGTTGDIPVQGDYDRDGITDLAVFRPSTSNWYILRSSDSAYIQYAFGATGDKPVPADYDGDGKTDLAVWTPSSGAWNYLSSAGNYGSYSQIASYGISTDIPVPADYDGDAKADFAVYRPSEGNWYILQTSLAALGVGQSTVVHFGLAGDIPQPADYDSDGKVDQAVFRPSNNNWYLNRSTQGFTQTTFGQTGDAPVSSANPNTNQ